MKAYTAESPKFYDTITIVETTDTNHADNINTSVKQIYENTLVLKNQAGVPGEYNPESSYSVGDLVTHDGKVFQCKTAIEEGGEEWNPDHWDEIASLFAQFGDLKEATALYYVDITLTAEGWTTGSAPFTQTVMNEAINEHDALLLRAPEQDADEATLKAYNKAFSIVSQGTAETHKGNVSFSVLKKPETDIKVRLLMRGGDAAEAVPDPDNAALDASDLSVKDTHGIVGAAQGTTTLQQMLDGVADKILNVFEEDGSINDATD